jgi:hypothetical protein
MGTCESAAVGGHLEVLQWARANSCPWDRRKTEHSAQLYLHDHVYAWIRQQPLKDDDVPTPEPQRLLPMREYFASQKAFNFAMDHHLGRLRLRPCTRCGRPTIFETTCSSCVSPPPDDKIANSMEEVD